MSLHQHEKLIEKKFTLTYKIQRLLVLIIYGLAIGTLVYQIYANKQIAAGVGVFSAAIIFSLQNFVASFFARLYIKGAGLFEKGDIIKSGNPFMSAIGEVQTIGLFFTTINEITEHELTFTDKVVSFPNYLIFNSGIFNFTKNNLLFWHEMKFLVGCKGVSVDTVIEKVKEIINAQYLTMIQDKIYTSSFLYKNKKWTPKYQYTISPEGLEITVRIMVHLYKKFETHNLMTQAMITGHQNQQITLIVDKDSDWI